MIGMRVIKPEELFLQTRRLGLDQLVVGRSHQKPPPRPFFGGVGQRRDMGDQAVAPNQRTTTLVRIRFNSVPPDRVRMGFALTAIVIIGREIAISALREWMAELGQRAKVAVSIIGKYKTILQIIGLSMMLYRWDLLGLPIFEIGAVLTAVAAALTLLSMFSYLKAAWPELKRH